VTCCKSCNTRKNDRTPQEAGMKLKKVPQRPSISEFIILKGKKLGIAEIVRRIF
jgi:hypothetical protein